MTKEEYCTNDKTYIVSFSGGKDSVATYLHLTRELGFKNVFVLFADTGWEHKSTYDYINDLINNHGFKISLISGSTNQLTTKNRDFGHEKLTMVTLSKIKKGFPSSLQRFCTTELKLIPILSAYQFMNTGESKFKFFNDGEILPNLQGKEVVMVTGIRSEESAKRAMMNDFIFDDFFKVYRWLPIQQWTWQEVFAIHHKYNIKVNPLYLKGMGRVGCFPCINATKTELSSIARQFPETFDELKKLEDELSFTFFKPNKTPSSYHGQTVKSKKKGIDMTVANALDVKAWALGQTPENEMQLDFFDSLEDTINLDAPVCESQYGLCELAMKYDINIHLNQR